MATTAFDTLNAAQRLKAAGIKPEHAEAIAEVMGLYFNQPRRATAEHYDARTANVHEADTRPDAGKAQSAARRDAVQSTARSEISARTDTVRTNRWKDCLDVEVVFVWLMTLTTILACANTLLYIT